VEKNHPQFKRAEEFILSKLENELAPTLFYHNIQHTLDVLDAAIIIANAEKIPADDIKLLRVAVLFHDAGFIHVYKNHEEKGCEMAMEYLPAFHFTAEQAGLICGMIMATKIPQNPQNLLEEIIADADLDYLGREDVYTIAGYLYDELQIHVKKMSEEEWLRFQVNFLKHHHYYTGFSKTLREPKQQSYMQTLVKEIQAGQ
jgi:uncharacterized protein